MTASRRGAAGGRASPESKQIHARGAWLVLAILCGLMVMNHLDRQVVAAMLPLLRQQWGLRDVELGTLVSVVSLAVAMFAIPLSVLAERWGHVRSLFAMAVIWSVATAACALARGYHELLAARILVGVGEAAYGSVGAALLATLFPGARRAGVMATFLVGGLLGSVCGVMAGGMVSARWGWPTAFVLAGALGIVLAVAFRLATGPAVPPPRADGRDARRPAVRSIVVELWTPRSARVGWLASGLQLVAISAMYAWLPSFLAREYAWDVSRSGVLAGIVVLMGIPGGIAAAVLTDRLVRRTPQARYTVPAVASALTAVAMSSAFVVVPAGPGQLAALMVTAFVMTGTVGSVTAAVLEVVHPFARGTAAAVLAVTQNFFGLGLGPAITGALSDRFGLTAALGLVPLASAAAAVLFVAAARPYIADRQRVADDAVPGALRRASI